MSRVGIFRNEQYAVLIIEDEQGRLIHRTYCIPAWLQFPFMRAQDVQLGDVYTAHADRRHGVALFALRYCIQRLAGQVGDIYYVAQTVNSPSHLLALKAGLTFLSLAEKRPARILGYYSLIAGAKDYECVRLSTDPRYSMRQIRMAIRRLDGGRARQIRPRRILAVIPISASLSSMIFARRQMAALAARGHSVETFELHHRRSLSALIGAVFQYRKRLRAFRPDVVHVHYGAMTAFFGVYGAIDLSPVVVTFRGSDLNPVPSMSAWRVVPSHILSNAAALAASHLICVSEELRNRLWYGTDKAALIPTGVDTTKFFPGSRAAERRVLGWDEDTPVVLFNAGNSPQIKRLDFANEIVSLAREAIPSLKFVVLGGEVPPDDIPRLMRASDCLLFTSDFEGSPTVIQEAMACNLPIVSVPVGDVAERLINDRHSVVLPRETANLAGAVVQILRGRQRSNGYEIAKAELGNEAIMEAVEEVYDCAMASRQAFDPRI